MNDWPFDFDSSRDDLREWVCSDRTGAKAQQLLDWLVGRHAQLKKEVGKSPNASESAQAMMAAANFVERLTIRTWVSGPRSHKYTG